MLFLNIQGTIKNDGEMADNVGYLIYLVSRIILCIPFYMVFVNINLLLLFE